MNKHFSMIAAAVLVLFIATNAVAADMKLLCDGCDEGKYRQVAKLYGDNGDYVLVTDLSNDYQRKYLISEFPDPYDPSIVYEATIPVSVPSSDNDYLEWALAADDAIGDIGMDDFCGPGWLGDVLVWDGPSGAYAPACEEHDACYQAGGDEQDREECDWEFYWNLRLDAGAQFGSVAFFMAVRRGGQFFFNYTSGVTTYYPSGGAWGCGNNCIDPNTGIIPLSPP